MSSAAKTKTAKPAEKPAAKGTALVARTARAPVIQSRPPVNMLEVISRAAADPNTDVDKLERLMAMAERAKAKEARTAYYADLAEMQDELPSIKERGEIKISENKPGQKYALWEDINAAIKPIMKKHGFAISFRTGIAEAKITVTGVLSHRAGHAEETTIHLPSDTSGSKNAVQAVGSSTSYGKRYTAAALLNLTSGGEDDDGLAAGSGGVITDDQAERILELLTRDKADVQLFCKSMKIENIIQLPVSRYREAIERINTRSQIVKQKEGAQP